MRPAHVLPHFCLTSVSASHLIPNLDSRQATTGTEAHDQ